MICSAVGPTLIGLMLSAGEVWKSVGKMRMKPSAATPPTIPRSFGAMDRSWRAQMNWG